MTRKVFIFGTSHKLQCGAEECGGDKISLLEKEIRRVLSKYGIRHIAEEMSDDGLRKIAGDKASGTVCQCIAGIAGNDVSVHHFVDLDQKERACLSLSDVFMFKQSKNKRADEGLRDGLSNLCCEVRERVWVARVLSRDEWPVLFVCGPDHADSVSELFKRITVQATVICRDFDPDAVPQ